MMLVRGRVEKQGKKFIIHNPSMPNFDNYISDLAVMFDTYPIKDDRQLHEVRVALGLIEGLEKVADKLPELPREKGKQMRLTEQQKNCPYCHAPYKLFISTGRETPIDLKHDGLIYTGVSNRLGDGPIAETILGVVNVLKVPYCPFCRRPLNEEPER